MKCSKCGAELVVSEANAFYYKGREIPSADLDMYPESQVKAVCQRCI